MTYVPGFKYDIFISYSHIDNITYKGKGDNGSDSGWMRVFCQLFKEYMYARSGEKSIQLYFDEETGPKANERMDALDRDAAQSAVFIAMGSVSYLNSDYTLREWAAFAASPQVGGHPVDERIFLAECMPLMPEQSYPPPIDQEHFRLRLYVEKTYQRPLEPMPPESETFRWNIMKLADQVIEKLRSMRNSHQTAALPTKLPAPPKVVQLASIAKQSLSDFEHFSSILSEERAALAATVSTTVSEDITNLPVRHACFSLFKNESDGKIAMAICDADKKIAVKKLKKSNESIIKYAEALSSDFKACGFNDGKAHPFIENRNNSLDRIYLDATIYLQSVYFPRSLIRLRTSTDGKQSSVDVEIGAFRSALEKFHVSKLITAAITAGQWNDDILLKGIAQLSIETRFAPTPSSSLHIGNARSALLPYLFYRSKPKEGNFILRFDDTDHTRNELVSKAEIKKEMQWLNFLLPEGKIFEESSDVHQQIYMYVFEMLQRCGLVKRMPNRDEWLNWEDPSAQFGIYLDITRGPKVIHRLMKNGPADAEVYKDRKLDLASLALKRAYDSKPANPGFDYKFCGTVDDILWSTLIVRDKEQGRNFTQRQALIRNAIAYAWRKTVDDANGVLTERQRHILNMRAKLRGEGKSPLPLFAPPIYYHAALVVERVKIENTDPKDDRGTVVKYEIRPISKSHRNHKNQLRESDPAFFLKHMMDRYRLPETLISYLLSTIVPLPRNTTDDQHRQQMARLCGELGAEQAIDIIASQASLSWLQGARPEILAKSSLIDRQERYVLQNLSYYNFIRRIKSFHDLRPIFSGQFTETTLEKIFLNLKFFGSWQEVGHVALNPRGDVMSDPRVCAMFSAARRAEHVPTENRHQQFLRTFRESLPPEYAHDFKAAGAYVRHALTGLAFSPPGKTICPGPPLLVLADILQEEYNQKEKGGD